MKKFLLLFSAIILLAISSCKKHKGPVLKGVLFTDTLSMYIGDTKQVNYTVSPSDYDPQLLNWKSSDTAVAVVTNTGNVTAKKAGSSTISLTNKSNTFSVSGIIAVRDSLNIGLLAFYPFNSNTKDLSGHSYNGTAHNLISAEDRFKNANAAYDFNGINSYITVKDNIPLRLNKTDFTLNYWINLTSYSNSYGSVVIGKRSFGYANGWITGVGGMGNIASVIGKAGTVTYNVSGGGDPFAYGQIVVRLEGWHMITVTYSYALSRINTYIDGVFDSTTYNIPTPNELTDSDMYIGADSQGNNNPSSGDYLVKGKIDDIRIYNRIIGAKELHRLFIATQ